MNNDLISRSALKKALKNNCTPELCYDYKNAWCLACCPHNDFEDLIDNAPTVEAKTTHDINSAYDRGFITAMKEYSRPHGEWLIVKDEKWGDNVKCPFCGKELAGTDLNFCCKCGAKLFGSEKMNGGAE